MDFHQFSRHSLFCKHGMHLVKTRLALLKKKMLLETLPLSYFSIEKVKSRTVANEFMTKPADAGRLFSPRYNFRYRSKWVELINVFLYTDTLHFIPLEHEPRIYLAAPSGVQVARVTAVDHRNPELAIKYSLDPTKYDNQFFQIHPESGNITTRRWVFVFVFLLFLFFFFLFKLPPKDSSK